MDEKINEVSSISEEVYKDLPVRARARVNATARKLLEIQKGDKAFCDEGVDRSGDGEKETGGTVK